jgi:hypothetical protein
MARRSPGRGFVLVLGASESLRLGAVYSNHGAEAFVVYVWIGVKSGT